MQMLTTTPALFHRYAHPDVAIGLTILAYRYEGLRPADFGANLLQLRSEFETESGSELQRPSAIIWIRWIFRFIFSRLCRYTS